LIGREVISAGVPSEASSEGLKRLKNILQTLQPDIVILCHGGNDTLHRLRAEQTPQNFRANGAEVVLVAALTFGLFPRVAGYYNDIDADSSKKSD